MFNWFFNLFRRRPLAERQQEAKETAIGRAIRKCRKYWKLKEWKPFELVWIEGDGIEGGVPYKYDDRWASPYGGLYYLGQGKIVMVMFMGRFSVRVLVHEICHYILDMLLRQIGRITWHHTSLSWLVFGWRPESYAKAKEEEMKKQGKVATAVRRIVRCPKLVEAQGFDGDCKITADVLPAKRKPTQGD